MCDEAENNKKSYFLVHKNVNKQLKAAAINVNKLNNKISLLKDVARKQVSKKTCK